MVKKIVINDIDCKKFFYLSWRCEAGLDSRYLDLVEVKQYLDVDLDLVYIYASSDGSIQLKSRSR